MTRKKRIALATLPALALVVLGTSVASAHMRGPRELSEEQRTALEEARELRKEGNEEEARSVLVEAGLSPERPLRGMHGGHGMGALHDGGMHEQREKIHAALEAHDYAAFKEATVDAPFSAMVTEENFEKLVEAHKLREAGDLDGAFAIMRELGFPEKGPRWGRGMHE